MSELEICHMITPMEQQSLQGESVFLNPPAANDGNPSRTPGRGKRGGRGGGGRGEGGFETNSRGRGRGVWKKDRSNLKDCEPSRSRETTTLAPEDSPYSVADSVADSSQLGDDADSFTCKEVLMILAASGDVTMKRELAKFLQAEAKETQERSVAKVQGWLQSQQIVP